MELIRLATAMIASNNHKVSGPSGRTAIEKTPSAEQLVAKMYHFLGESVTSTAGAHDHFSHCEIIWAPPRSEPSVMERPLWVARKVSATVTKPLSAPNGRYNTV